MSILLTILGLALLMVVHEGGHHLVARAFGLRVVRFSIGFGPSIWKHQPRGSDTIYQVALIPFLAYVQIAGMNPFEDNDPTDTGSYANASLTARIATVIAGPLANYLFASVLFFAAFLAFGKVVSLSTTVKIVEGGAAAAAQMQDGDKIVRIDKAKIATFEEMRQLILKSPDKELTLAVERGAKQLEIKVTPKPSGPDGGGLIGVQPTAVYGPMSVQESLTESLLRPALVVQQLVVGLSRVVRGKEEVELNGPVGIVKIGASMADTGLREMLLFLGTLSAYLGGFNLLPIPALDGGRLTFLGFEAVARRKPNAKIEAQIHAIGLLMFLALIAVVTVQDFQR